MSGAVLSETGHAWIGCDISADMLSLAQGNAELLSNSSDLQHGMSATRSPAPSCPSRTGYNKLNHRHVGPEGAVSQLGAGKGLVFQVDMAQGLPLKPNSLDGAVSISAVQWLCHLPSPKLALNRLFRDLYRCLKPGCKAVLQVYLAGLLKHGCLAFCMNSCMIAIWFGQTRADVELPVFSNYQQSYAFGFAYSLCQP